MTYADILQRAQDNAGIPSVEHRGCCQKRTSAEYRWIDLALVFRSKLHKEKIQTNESYAANENFSKAKFLESEMENAVFYKI